MQKNIHLDACLLLLSKCILFTFNCYSTSEINFTLPRFNWVASVPQVVFDIPTDHGGQTGQQPCGVYFTNETVLLLGTGCKAGWQNSTQLQVSLGWNAVIMVGDDLVLQPGLIRNRQQTSYYSFGSIRLGLDMEQMLPFVSISAPAEIGDCDDLLLDARQSNATGGRPLKFRWGVMPGDEVEEAIMVMLSALSPAAATVVVNSSLLRAGRKLTFSVEVVNFAGGLGGADFSVSVQAGSVPLVYIEGTQVRQVSPLQPLWLCANVSRSVCEPTLQLAFQWTVESASDGAPPALVNATGRRLYVPSGTFLPGVEYIVKVLAYMLEAPGRSSSARVVLQATEPPLAFRIDGGSRTASFGNALGFATLFAAVASPNAFRSFLWACDPVPCFAGADKLAINSSSELYLAPGLLLPATYLVSVLASAQIGPARQVGTQAVKIYVVPGSSASVTVSGPNDAVVNPADEVLLTGQPPRYLHLDWIYQWRQLSGENALLGTSSTLGVATDLLGFGAGVLTAGQEYRFRLEAGPASTGMVGLAEILVVAAAAPVAGRLDVTPTIGFAVDSVFRMSASGWVDDPVNLPLIYIFGYIVGADAGGDTVPLGAIDDLDLDVRLPRISDSPVSITFSLTVQNQAGCETIRTAATTVYPPVDPAASAEALLVLLDEARYTEDLEAALACSNALTSLLSASGTALRRAAGNSVPCSNDGVSCDNDGLRLLALKAVRTALAGVVLRAVEAGMFAASIRAATSAHINQTTQLAVVNVAQMLVAAAIVGPNADGISSQAEQDLVDTGGLLLLASNDTSSSMMLNHSALIAEAVESVVHNLANYLVSGMYVGEIQREVYADGLQLLTLRIPRGIGGSQQVQLDGTTALSVELQPAALLGATVVESLDTVLVQWGSNVHPRGVSPLGSTVATVNLSAAAATDGSGKIQLSALETPVLLTFAKGIVRGDSTGSTINDCRFWDGAAEAYKRAGTIVGEDGTALVTCEVYHLTDFASLVGAALSGSDPLAIFAEPNPFERWTPDRVLAFAVCLALLATYAAGCAAARRADRLAVAKLAAEIQQREVPVKGSSAATVPESGGIVVRSEEEAQRSRDYVMIKAILKQRLASRYRSWRVQTLELLRTEHILGGVVWRPVFSSFTRPRRLTCLFVVFLGNLALNVLLLGRGAFAPAACIAAGVVAAVVVFPVGLFFVAAFKAVDSETTWRMHRRRRVRRVQESVAVRAALDLAVPPTSPAQPAAGKPPPSQPRVGPSPPSSERPAFTRRSASRSTGGSLLGATPPVGRGSSGVAPRQSLGWPTLALPPARAEIESTLYRPTAAVLAAGERPTGGVSGLQTFASRNTAVRSVPVVPLPQQRDVAYYPQGAPPPVGGGPLPPPGIGFTTYGSGATPPPPPPPGDNPRPPIAGRGRGRPVVARPPPRPPGLNPRPAAPSFVSAAGFAGTSGGPPPPPAGRNIRPRVPGSFQPIRMAAALAQAGNPPGVLFDAAKGTPAPPPLAPPPEGRSSRPRLPQRGPPRPPGAYLPRRLFGFNPAASSAGVGDFGVPTLPSAFEQRQMLVEPFAPSAGQDGGRARGGTGRLSTIVEGREDEDEQRVEPATLPTRAKPVRHIAESRLRWLRERLLAREDGRRNELLLLLPPQAAYGVYAVALLWMVVCCYLILLHGLQFTPELELAWVIASVVAALQELLVQQVCPCC